jgi:hypothetical protein
MIRTYRYVSDTKVDMYAAQIPRGLRDKIAAELSINVQLVGVTLKQQPSDETRYSKLRLVVDYIEKNEPVGTVEKPQTYFKGTLPMRWGPIGAPELDIAYFGAELPGLVVGLVGSRHHVIGGAGATAAISPSVDPIVLAAADVESWSMNGDPDSVEKRIMPFGSILGYVNTTLQDRPSENLEFLAVKLLQGTGPTPGGPTPFLLGSPIYVAIAPA